MSHYHAIHFFSHPGSLTRPNEDRMGAAHNTVWVIDGATGVGIQDSYVAQKGDTDASWLAQRLDEFFRKNAKSWGSDHAGFIQASHAFLDHLFKQDSFSVPEAPYAFPSAALTLLTYDQERIKISSLGDGTTLLRNEEGKILRHGGDPIHLAKDAAAKEELRALLQTRPPEEYENSRALILPRLRTNRATANEPGGYGFFTLSKPIPPSYIRSFECSRHGIRDLALFSDGFYAIVEDYREMNDAQLMEALRRDQAEDIAAEIRSIEDSDPEGVKYPRFKKSDDATALYLKLSK